MILPLLLTCALAFLSAALGQLVASQIALIPLRRLPATAHWTERARHGWSARVVVSIGPAIILGAMLALDSSEWPYRLLSPLAGFAGATGACLPALRVIYGRRV